MEKEKKMQEHAANIRFHQMRVNFELSLTFISPPTLKTRKRGKVS